MGIQEVRREFSTHGVNLDILEFDQSSATVEQAAIALDTEPDRIAKTMAFKVNDNPLLIVLKGSARVDNRKYKDRFGVKAKMLSAEEVAEVTGHKIGGVCPFGLKQDIPIFLDVSLKEFDVVYPAAGSANSAVRVPVPSFRELVKGEWIDVSK